MSARTDLYDYLVQAFSPDPDEPPTIKIVPAPDGTDPEPAYDLLVVGSDEVTPGITIARARNYHLTVIVVGRLATPGPADDHLDELLETVLDVLDDASFLSWDKAERGVYRESFPSYIVTVNKER